MGLFNLEKLLGMGGGGKSGGSAGSPAQPVTRWEKALTAINGLAQQVSKIDPDGIDVYCFSGQGVQRYQDITNPEDVASLVSRIQPNGRCRMNQAFEVALNDAKAKGGEKPVSMLVLTAGLPDDKDPVIQRLTRAVAEQSQYLTITFVQIGDDPQAEAFLKHVDDNLVRNVGGKMVDIIDTLKDEEIQNAMAEMQGDSGKTGMIIGGLFGAVAGMALGAGGAHMIDQHFAKQRTRGWNGTWEVAIMDPAAQKAGTYAPPPGSSPTTPLLATGTILNVTDTMTGSITISGYPEDDSCGQRSEKGEYEDTPADAGKLGVPGVPGSYHLRRERISKAQARTCSKGCGRRPFKTYPTCCTHCKGTQGPHARDCKAKPMQHFGRYVTGTVVNENLIEWSDNTFWQEVAPDGTSYMKLGAGAALGGAAMGAAGGAVGALVQKKFFNRAASKTLADYVILLDCSAAMNVLDTGKGFKSRGPAVTQGQMGRDILIAALSDD